MYKSYLSKTFPNLKHFVVYFLIHDNYYISSIRTNFMKDITFTWTGDSSSGGSRCSCSGLERNYAWAISCLIFECCRHDHWRSIIKPFCAEETAVVHNSFNTQTRIIDIKKFNIVFNCTSCIKLQLLYTATTWVFSINRVKRSNINFTRCNWKT